MSKILRFSLIIFVFLLNQDFDSIVRNVYRNFCYSNSKKCLVEFLCFFFLCYGSVVTGLNLIHNFFYYYFMFDELTHQPTNPFKNGVGYSF